MVSLIILSFNTKTMLQSCLASFYKHIKDAEFEVIVIDNASEDGSAEMVKKEFKKAILIENKENVGFAKGCNQAAKLAKGEYLLFLNSDTELRESSLREAVAILEKREDLAIVGGSLQNQNGTTSRSYGHFLTPFWIFVMLFGIGRFIDKQSVQGEKLVDWVSGGCMLIKRSLFEKLQGFDEHFFMYIEDMELCYRIKQLGYGIIYYPHFAVIHKAQGSSNRGFAIEHIYKGLLYFYKKHMTISSYQFLRGMLYIKACGAMLIGIITMKKSLVETYKQAIHVI